MTLKDNDEVSDNLPPNLRQDDQAWWMRHPTLAYSIARLALFLLPFLILVIFLDPMLALVIAFVVSAVASIFVLSRMRDAMSVSITTRAERAQQKMAERAASEDAWDEARRTDGSAGDDR
jgi:hypothetical protein